MSRAQRSRPHAAITLGPNDLARGTLIPYRAAMPQGYTDIDWTRVKRMHLTQGRSVAEIAAELGASYHGVLRGLQKRGWLREREPAAHDRVHGRALYKAWSAIRQRCNSPKHSEYVHIGQRGISR